VTRAALTVAVAALVIGVAPASPAAGACSRAAAEAAIAQAKPRLALVGDRVLIEPGQAGRVLCFDATGDGRVDMVVSLASGGTAGDVGWLLFVPSASRWRLAGSGTGYKLVLRRSGSMLEVVQAVYRSHDPNCCPTGGFDHTLLRWSGGRLVVERAWHAARFR